MLNIKDGNIVDVNGGLDYENQNVVAVTQSDRDLRSQWDIMYLDEWSGEPQKGEYNERFGFYVNKEFSIQSELDSKRSIDIDGQNNIVINTS